MTWTSFNSALLVVHLAFEVTRCSNLGSNCSPGAFSMPTCIPFLHWPVLVCPHHSYWILVSPITGVCVCVRLSFELKGICWGVRGARVRQDLSISEFLEIASYWVLILFSLHMAWVIYPFLSLILCIPEWVQPVISAIGLAVTTTVAVVDYRYTLIQKNVHESYKNYCSQRLFVLVSVCLDL